MLKNYYSELNFVDILRPVNAVRKMSLIFRAL